MNESRTVQIYNSVHILISHILKHKRITGLLPDTKYLVTCFEIPYEFADYLLEIVGMMQRRQEQP